MNEIYGWCLKRGGGGVALETLWTSCFISSLLIHVGYMKTPFCTCARLAVWLHQGHHKVICFPLHRTSPDPKCLFKHFRRSIQSVRCERCDSFPHPLCSAYPHRRCSRRPLGGGVRSPQTKRTSWLWPAPALPEELRPEPLGGRGRAWHTEPRTNERSAHPPRRGWLITSTHSSPLKSAVLISTANCLLLCPMGPQRTMTKSGVLDWQMQTPRTEVFIKPLCSVLH